MRYSKRSILSIGIICLLLIFAISAGCSKQSDKNNANNSDHQQTEQPGNNANNNQTGQHDENDEQSPDGDLDGEPGDEPADPDHQAILDILDELTLEQKIGQLFMVGLDGTTVTESDLKQIETNRVGGFILFGRNIESPDQTTQLIHALQQSNRNAGNPPLFFSVDEEGGRVSRMPNGLTSLPSAKSIGERATPEQAKQLSEANGNILKALGFNMNFAPVLDVNSNPNNPIIGDRAYGDTADKVSTYGLQTLIGLKHANIIPVVKHFPGHGDTELDSHLDLPVIDHDLDRLEQIEFAPFKKVTASGDADVMMVGHLVISAIDPNTPASLSREILNDKLRGAWGYDGVVITDDMTMDAITDYYGIGEGAVKAVDAGVDILLIGHDRELQQEAIDALKVAVQAGELTEERINESVIRILKLKKQYQISDEAGSAADLSEVNARLTTLLEQL